MESPFEKDKQVGGSYNPERQEELRRARYLLLARFLINKFERGRKNMNPEYSLQKTVEKFLKGAAGSAVAYILLYLIGGHIPSMEQVNLLLTQLADVSDKLFLAIGVLTGLWHAVWNMWQHLPKKPVESPPK